MQVRILNALVGLVVLGNAACGPLSSVNDEPVQTPTSENPSPAPTEIVWFPPTATKAFVATSKPAPTPERKPGVGELMISDAMTSAKSWDASTAADAPVAVSGRGLTVSAEPNGHTVVAMHRSAMLDDMYIEVSARPSLCREHDAYGLVFRAPNEVAYYRFLAICNGSAAAERVSIGPPRVLQPPTPSADAPAGAPGEVRLGVWALGQEFRFFLNGHYQFTVQDSNYRTGGIGVFVQSGGETPAVVTFSDLAVYRLDPAAASASPTP